MQKYTENNSLKTMKTSEGDNWLSEETFD